MFMILPILLELGLTMSVLLSLFKYYFTLIVIATICVYLAVTFLIQEWKNKLYLLMNQRENSFN